jgi:hypothetical protein
LHLLFFDVSSILEIHFSPSIFEYALDAWQYNLHSLHSHEQALSTVLLIHDLDDHHYD